MAPHAARWGAAKRLLAISATAAVASALATAWTLHSGSTTAPPSAAVAPAGTASPVPSATPTSATSTTAAPTSRGSLVTGPAGTSTPDTTAPRVPVTKRTAASSVQPATPSTTAASTVWTPAGSNTTGPAATNVSTAGQAGFSFEANGPVTLATSSGGVPLASGYLPVSGYLTTAATSGSAVHQSLAATTTFTGLSLAVSTKSALALGATSIRVEATLFDGSSATSIACTAAPALRGSVTAGTTVSAFCGAGQTPSAEPFTIQDQQQAYVTVTMTASGGTALAQRDSFNVSVGLATS